MAEVGPRPVMFLRQAQTEDRIMKLEEAVKLIEQRLGLDPCQSAELTCAPSAPTELKLPSPPTNGTKPRRHAKRATQGR